MTCEAVIFDLDGTLLDTLDDLADSANIALDIMDYDSHPVDAYRTFVGDGVENLMRRALPSEVADNEEILARAVTTMRAEYDRRWAHKTRPYDGIMEMLADLKDIGIPLAVLSNKPHEKTLDCVAKFFPEGIFSEVCGVSEDTPHKPDPTGALCTMTALGATPMQTLYLGDTDTDMQTANNAGFFSVGALWGFRDADELRKHGARELVHSPNEVTELARTMGR